MIVFFMLKSPFLSTAWEFLNKLRYGWYIYNLFNAMPLCSHVNIGASSMGVFFSTPENAARHLQRPAVSKRPGRKDESVRRQLPSQSALIALRQ